MDVQITPRHLSGTVTPPPSKSMAHRLLIAAALGSGISTVRGVAMSQDVEATLRCLTALGGCWRQTAPGTLEITGIGGRRERSRLGAAPPGLRRIRLHFALLSSHRAGSGRRRRLYRSGPPDGPAPGPIPGPFPGEGHFL